jgi:protein involved in polysaccharide export with SLBB domain
MMRLTTKQPGQSSGSLSRRRTALSGALGVIAVNFALLGCTSSSYERSSDGKTVYIDELSESAKATARQRVVASLNRGIGVYSLGVGDEVEIYFHISRAPTIKEYVILAGDKLRVDFLGDTENSRNVQVQPDGRIALPLIGSVIAAGRTADALAYRLEQRYTGLLTEPKITINLSEARTAVDDFIDVVASSAKGRSLTDKVLPDGTISLPLLRPLPASGHTLKELQDEIDAAYRAKGLSVSVSIVPRSLRSNATLVVGEVTKPGQIELDQPTTVLMAVAQAGGALKTGAMNAVRLYYVDEDGVQHVRSINLDDVIEHVALEADTIVPPNSIIYVPPTELAKAGRFLDATLRDILLFQGVSVGAGFQLFPPNSGGGNVTIFNTPTSK